MYTHQDLYKMAAILQIKFFEWVIMLNKIYDILMQISLKCFFFFFFFLGGGGVGVGGLIGKKSSFIQGIEWHQAGDKPLLQPILISH